MPVPTFEDIMLPMLTLCGDGNEHALSELRGRLEDRFGLTPEERNCKLRSGASRFGNRVRWAGVYLRKAGVLESTGRGSVRITSRGLALLGERPARIDSKLLRRYREFVEFKRPSRGQLSMQESNSQTDEIPETPEEILETASRELRRSLAVELLDRVKTSSPRFFEQLTIDLLLAMGYGGSRDDASQLVGRAGDGGIDGVIKQDRLGLDVVYVQAKRWDGTVSSPVVRQFAGSLDGVRARKGIMITTSQFSREATEYAERI
ncbi:MAG: restriction endonuclease, partial [Firmicutes bacterium]|nr:restriction endonuclease [Bacillota bacterium]